MYFPNKHLSSLLALISALMVGHQAVSQSAIPDDKCAIITGATKDPEVALQAIKKFQEFGNPVVVQSSNGFLAPSIGLFNKSDSQSIVQEFKINKIIPEDSYCGNADRFIAVLYPNENFSALLSEQEEISKRDVEKRLASLEARELSVLDEEAQLKNLEIRLETFKKNLEQRSKDIAQRLAELDKRELALLEKEATLEKLGIRLETTQKEVREKSKDIDDDASFTQTQEYMDYENFLFDVEAMLGTNVQVQVPVFSLNIPDRTIQVDLENLKIDVSQIDKKTLKDINALCNVTGANCYLNVDGILVRNPEMFPTYSISANHANLMFLVGVAVSEEGLVYVHIDEQSAINTIIQTTGGTQSYISGFDYINSTGTFAVAHAIGVSEYYAGWGFNPDQDLAIKKAVENCRKQITGLVNFTSKCEPVVFDVPWW